MYSLTVLFTIAYKPYLALEEGSPLFKQKTRFTYKLFYLNSHFL